MKNASAMPAAAANGIAARRKIEIFTTGSTFFVTVRSIAAKTSVRSEAGGWIEAIAPIHAASLGSSA